MAQSMEAAFPFFFSCEVPKVVDGENWPHFTRGRLHDGLRWRKLVFFPNCTKILFRHGVNKDDPEKINHVLILCIRDLFPEQDRRDMEDFQSTE